MTEELRDPEVIRATVAPILAAFPAWFGIPESTREYVEVASSCPCLVVREGHRPVGFLSYRRTSSATAGASGVCCSTPASRG